MAINVLVADDHQLVRQGLKALLEREGFKVVAEACERPGGAKTGGERSIPKWPSWTSPCRS